MAGRQYSAEEALYRVFEGSESSDEDVINVPHSEPLEPALQESALLEVPELFQQEEFEQTLEELDVVQQRPPLQVPQQAPLQQQEQAPPQQAGEPAPKRSRGRPCKEPQVLQPPPERPGTPPPQKTRAECNACKQRSLD
ncbi:hypothetical protein HOLleu_17278 [Holothuria leucospilota]|uniref:Uncharacterized protein n=1 Tax=Holothuria leucospilota TaxID=206669 RepID=A0A9Q1C7M0_HOLLE|nr:hypothetical protein HOLleu_17278 [Holothuria leucospilota]